jgi:hypothetical protein
MRRLALVAALVAALGVAAGTPHASASPGCRAFGQGLIASEAQDERPGVGEEARTFAPANDDVVLFKALTCG